VEDAKFLVELGEEPAGETDDNEMAVGVDHLHAAERAQVGSDDGLGQRGARERVAGRGGVGATRDERQSAET
jgi:hypothetical protein